MIIYVTARSICDSKHDEEHHTEHCKHTEYNESSKVRDISRGGTSALDADDAIRTG
jgi:hypothetical protein